MTRFYATGLMGAWHLLHERLPAAPKDPRALRVEVHATSNLPFGERRLPLDRIYDVFPVRGACDSGKAVGKTEHTTEHAFASGRGCGLY